MFCDGCRAAQYFGSSLFVLDRYFLAVSLLKEWQEHEKEHPGMLHIITRAKKNCIAYEKPGAYKGRRRRPVRGMAVHLQDLFETEAGSFQTAHLQMYGCEREVCFLSKIYPKMKKKVVPYMFLKSMRF